jgi:hypothetical protein
MSERLILIEPIAWRDPGAAVEIKLSFDGLGFIVESLQRTNPKDEFTKWLADAYYAQIDSEGNRV